MRTEGGGVGGGGGRASNGTNETIRNDYEKSGINLK